MVLPAIEDRIIHNDGADMRKVAISVLAAFLGLAGFSACAVGSPKTSNAAQSGVASEHGAKAVQPSDKSAEVRITSTPEALREAMKKDGKTLKKGQKMEHVVSAKQLANIARYQLEHLVAYVITKVKPQLLKKGTFGPMGAMVYRDGHINNIVIKNPMSVEDKVKLYRLALRSLARHNKIDASVVVFCAEDKKGSNKHYIFMNYEHRFGVSGTRIIGYEIVNGKLKMTQPKDIQKPFYVFFDQNRLRKDDRVSGKHL